MGRSVFFCFFSNHFWFCDIKFVELKRKSCKIELHFSKVLPLDVGNSCYVHAHVSHHDFIV